MYVINTLWIHLYKFCKFLLIASPPQIMSFLGFQLNAENIESAKFDLVHLSTQQLPISEWE